MVHHAWKIATVLAAAAVLYLFVVGHVPGCDAPD